MIILTFTILNTLLTGGSATNPRARTEYGDVIGTQGTTLKGRRYNAFFSIPYAEKPIGGLRFEEAREPKPWLEPIEGTAPPPVCNQVNKGGEPIGQEDCLYLNVYTPTNNSNPLPVVIFVHGGAFFFFSANTFGPRYLLDKDIVLVTFNYRLGIFGFLCTEDEVVPGNNGLKDQSLAFGWVHRNIAGFGGDPSSVTLLGFSAGAASIHYHYFSILSRGLFHRGYLIGGTAFNHWAVQKKSLQRAKVAAEYVGCTTTSVPKMVECLKHAPADNLALTTLLFFKFLNTPLCPWGPVLDKNWSNNPFLQEYPIQSILASRHYNVPLVASETPDSGLFPISEFIERRDVMEELDENWDQLAPYFLDTIDTVPPQLLTLTSKIIRSYYFGRRPLYENTTALVKVATDRLFQADIGRALSVHAMVNHRIYFYFFNYRGAKSSSDSLSGTTKNYGVSHIDDIFYLMNATAVEPNERSKTGLKMIERMTDMFYNFARTGRPVFLENVSWLPVRGGPSSIRYLRIDSPDRAVMDASSNLGNINFWAALSLNEPWAGRLLF